MLFNSHYSKIIFVLKKSKLAAWLLYRLGCCATYRKSGAFELQSISNASVQLC